MKAFVPGLAVMMAAGCLTACDHFHHAPEKTASASTVLWKSHDMSRPRPAVITAPAQSLPVPPPSNAVILFDGKDLSQWTNDKGEAPGWKIVGDHMEAAPGTGPVKTKNGFGDMYLHVEWAAPNPPHDTGQGRGNSGVFLMTKYEVQVLDSYHADTYTDGQAGALYGQVPPLFNVCRPPGEWQTYDIFFRRPRFAADSSLLSPASVTVLQNGILIQNNEQYQGPTSWLKHFDYASHPDELPILLQDHGNPVLYRNIWLVKLPERAMPPTGYGDKSISLDASKLENYTGVYDRAGTKAPITITSKDGKLFGDFFWRKGELELVPLSDKEFALKETDGKVNFDLDGNGKATSLVFNLGGVDMPAKKAAAK